MDTAAKLAGKSAADVRPFLQQTGQSLDPTRMNWCAAFVNGVLQANGVQGTTGGGKNIATGFLNWGVPVQGEPQPGDVLVLPKGHPAGGLGGHVGIAVGQVADGPGGTFYLMQSGNEGDRVAYTWEPARGVVARRVAPQGQAPDVTPELQAHVNKVLRSPPGSYQINPLAAAPAQGQAP